APASWSAAVLCRFLWLRFHRFLASHRNNLFPPFLQFSGPAFAQKHRTLLYQNALKCVGRRTARQRLGVRLSSAAFSGYGFTRSSHHIAATFFRPCFISPDPPSLKCIAHSCINRRASRRPSDRAPASWSAAVLCRFLWPRFHRFLASHRGHLFPPLLL